MFSLPDGPLQTVRVLDYSRSAPAARCARHFSDLGARVVRAASPAALTTEDSIGADRVLIDWQTVEGRQLAMRFVEHADIVVLDTDDLPHPDIEPDRLLDRSTTLVVASMSAYGSAGPATATGATSDRLAAAVEAAWLTTAAASTLVAASLAALVHRRATGQGQWVHTSLLELALAGDAELRRTLRDDPQVLHLAMASMTQLDGRAVTRHPATATETPILVRRAERHPDDVAAELLAELGFVDGGLDALIEAGALLTEPHEPE